MRKTILFSGCAALAMVAVFSLSVRDSSLESLRANAGVKCVEARNRDCRSASTGNIYTGYTAQKIGDRAVSEGAY